MKRQRFFQNTAIIVLGVAIVFMSIGYSAFGTNFEIKGATTIQSSLWDIHFENTTTTSATNIEDTERITPASVNSGTSILGFAVSLKPGEIYEFVTTVRNGGTLDGKLESISLNVDRDSEAIKANGLEYISKNIKYTVTYEDGTEIKVGDTLDAGFSKKIVVRVEYTVPEDPSELPEKPQGYEFSISMNYIQA